ncbi:MAG: hypothetical protein CM15mP59_6290 [Flavobacteriaceae bacterium]|nr:MAG: hypothetical protein CM15mP59_6290 [Flavobacteriaceae bacterium]
MIETPLACTSITFDLHTQNGIDIVNHQVQYHRTSVPLGLNSANDELQ